jgi:hypothetical protein
MTRPGSTPPLDPRPNIRFKPKKHEPQAEKLELTQKMLDLCVKNSTDSPLLRLPIGIRKRIYEYVFSTGETIELLPWDSTLMQRLFVEPEEDKKTGTEEAMGADIGDNDMLVPSSPLINNETKRRNILTRPFAALFTSRQFYLETHVLPFSCNTIHCHNMLDLLIVLNLLSPTRVSSIRTLKIRWPTARLAIQEYVQSAGSMRGSSMMVKRALRMLDGLQRIVVDSQGYYRTGLERRLVELTLQYACEKKVNVSFEVAAKEMLLSPYASTCGLGLTKWKCFYGRKEPICKAGKCYEGVPLRDLVVSHVSIPRY